VKAVGTDLGAAFLAPPSSSVAVDVVEGEPIEVTFEFDIPHNDILPGALAATFGIEPDLSDPEGLIAEAVEAAKNADVAVVVVGTNAKVESEGYDRSNLDLPGRQDDLVRAVAAANPRTVVVVNSGAPVLLPWRDEVAAILLSWFGGQEYGDALADMLLGSAEPGGRLPTTWPAALDDVPVINVTPVDGKVPYTEGIQIGYRAWLKAGTVPAYEFGHGLGYTTWELSDLALSSDTIAEGETVEATVTVKNTGPRAGKQVVQVYASRADSAIERPRRWLVGFAPVSVGAGSTATATITIPARAFADWSVENGGWHYEAGEFTVQAGTSVSRLPLIAQLRAEST
jgi:beta-glucosidase